MPSYLARWCLTALALTASPLLAQDWSIREPTVDGKNVAAWVKELNSPDVAVRRIAVRKLASLARGSGDARAALTSALADADEIVRNKALLAIPVRDSDFDNACLELAKRILHATNPDLRRQAVLLLGRSKSSAAVDLLLDAFSDADDRVRSDTALELRQAPLSLEQERRLLETWQSIDRYDSRKEFGVNPEKWLTYAVGASPMRTAEALRIGTRHPRAAVRLAVLALCSDFRLEPERIRPILRRFVADPDPRVRSWALAIAGNCESDDMFVLDALAKGIRDADPEVRDAAVVGLTRYKSANPACLAALMTLTHHNRPAVRAAAVQALHEFADDERRVLRPLMPLFADADPGVRVKIVSLAIRSRTRDPIVHDAIMKAMLDPDPEVACCACSIGIEALEDIDRTKLTDALFRALREANARAVREAADRLARMNPTDPRAIAILAERCREADDPESAHWFMSSLFGFPGAGHAALEKAVPGLRPDIAAELFERTKGVSPASLLRLLFARAIESRKSKARKLALEAHFRFNLERNRKDDFGPTTVDNLVLAAKDPDPGTRHAAYLILRFAPATPAVVQSLLDGTKENDPSARIAAIQGLGIARVFPEQVLDVLRKAVQERGQVGAAAVHAIFKVDLADDELGQLALDHIRSGDRGLLGAWIRENHARITAVVPQDRLVAEWCDRVDRELAGDSFFMCLYEVIPFTGSLVPREQMIPLLAKMGCHWHPDVRTNAIELLGKIGPVARSALPMLEARSRDADPKVADAAQRAITKIRQ
jgi:HEAT repeat protein